MRCVASDSAEKEFLFHVARVAVGTAPFMCELLPRVRDWEHVFRLASQHAVTPLLCQVLSPRVAGKIPAGAMTLRRVASRRLFLRNSQSLAVLMDILDLFERNEIPVTPLKGPSLAFQLYGESDLRASVDLDFLVRAEDVLRARDVLLSRGYQTDFPTEPSQQAVYLRVRHDLRFTREGTFPVDLHQTFLPAFNRFAYDYGALWARLRRVRFNDRNMLVIPPEDLLLVLCAHGTKHVWGRLGWICDIARLLVRFREEISWSRVDELATPLGAQRMVSLGVLLAHDLLDAPLPEAILTRVQNDKIAVRLASRVSDPRNPWPLGVPWPISVLGPHLFFLRARERFRDRAAYCARLIFFPTERDHAAFSLPPVLSGLYYPLHTLRVTTKFGLASFPRSRA